MKTISIFDVIGPNMVGPSSSHTAGALRIALLARKMCETEIIKAEFVLYGSFEKTYRGHGTDRALVAGILGFGTEDARIRDSLRLAGEKGLSVSFIMGGEDRDRHPNTVEIRLWDSAGSKTVVEGVSVGGGNAEIRRINGVEINLTGEYPAILTKHRDEPGVLAFLTQCISEAGINIAFLKLYREAKGKNAYTIAQSDHRISEHVAEQIKGHPQVESAILVQ